MDRNVTVRFYQIETSGDHGISFEDSLRRAASIIPNEREADVGDGIILRLEHLEETQSLLCGDMTRVQTENLPSHPTHQSIEPLPVSRLGHHTAFCFDPVTQIIAIQFDTKMRIGRLCQYGSSFSNGLRFSYLPVLAERALERFEEETPTKLRVRVAQVNKFSDFSNELTNFERAFEQMGALFAAPSVDVTLSCRGKDGGLNKNQTFLTIRRLLGLRENFNGIRSITAETDESADPFNFINHLLKFSTQLPIPANDPDVARGIRINYTKQCINDQLNYIRATYRPIKAV